MTGVPVETLPVEEVAYWPERTGIMGWARERVRRTYDGILPHNDGRLPAVVQEIRYRVEADTPGTLDRKTVTM